MINSFKFQQVDLDEAHGIRGLSVTDHPVFRYAA